jgi:predicted glycogen debranching enzyme
LIEFGPGTCGNLDQALGREWLETNGIGGFASSTIAGVNTRRYHALLTAALENPPGRFVLLSKLETTLLANGSRYPLSANIYPGAVHPQGFRMLPRFRLDPFPVFTHEAAGRTIEQRITMAREENTTVIEYRLLSGDACGCELLPLIAFRGYHELTHKNEALSSAVTHGDGTASIQPYSSLPRLFFSFTRGAEFLE